MKFDGVPAEKISVVYHGFLQNEETVASMDGLPERYIMYVGKRTYGKNYPLFSRAVVDILVNRKDVCLVLTGDPLSESEKMLYSEAGVLDRVVNRFLTDAEMRYALSPSSSTSAEQKRLLPAPLAPMMVICRDSISTSG